MSIDASLREALLSHAHEAPTGVGLLPAVQARSRQRQRRRRIAVAGLAALVTAGGAIGLPAVWADRGLDRSTPASAGPPGPTGPARLVPSEIVVPSMPYTPGWTPSGLTPASISYNEGNFELSHRLRGHNSAALWFTVLSEEPAWTNPTEYEPVEVRGTTGKLWTNAGGPLLTWREGDRWLSVGANSPLTEADVQRFADELRSTPTPIGEPFRFAFVPAGSVLSGCQPSLMSLSSETGQVTVAVHPHLPTDPPAHLTVAGRPAAVANGDDPGITYLRVYLANGWTLTISTGGSLNLAPDDLIRFAEGITITADARVET